MTESIREQLGRVLTFVEDDLGDSLKFTWSKDSTDKDIAIVCDAYVGQAGEESQQLAALVRAARDLDVWMSDRLFNDEESTSC